MDKSMYVTDLARSLQSLKANSRFGSSSCHKHRGSIHPPLLNLELDRIVLDELHLMLRIGDNLIRNLVLYASSQDHRQSNHNGVTTSTLRSLEQLVRSCGVSFKIWQCRDSDGKPQQGRYEWTALTGKHKLKVLQDLPTKLHIIIPDEIAARLAKLWHVSTALQLCTIHMTL